MIALDILVLVGLVNALVVIALAALLTTQWIADVSWDRSARRRIAGWTAREWEPSCTVEAFDMEQALALERLRLVTETQSQATLLVTELEAWLEAQS